MRVTCVLVVVFGVFVASALSIDNGFGCNEFNVNGGCGSSLPPTSIQSSIIDAIQYRLLDVLTKQTSDSAKAALKPQIRKEFFSISPIKRFSQPSSPLTIPFFNDRNLEVPEFQFIPSGSITSGFLGEAQPTQIGRTGILTAIKPGSVNSERGVGGVLRGGSYPEVLNESFLGNSNGVLAGIDSPFLGNGGLLEGSRSLLSGSSAVECGILNGCSSQGY